MTPAEEIAKYESLLAAEVAERQALERELREREERFQALFRAIPAGLAIVDQQLRYVHVNETLAGFDALAAEEHLGKSLREVSPDMAQAMERTIKRVLRTGEPELNCELEGEIAADPGAVHQWLGSFVPLRGADGEPYGVSVLLVDVTARRNLENALQESEARYQMLMEHSENAILVFDERGNVIEVNPKVYEMFGYTKKELSQLNVGDLIPEEDLIADPIPYDDLRKGKTIRRERRLRRKDGTLIQVEVTGSMVSDGRMQSIVTEIPQALDSSEMPRQRPAAEHQQGVQPNGAGGGTQHADDPNPGLKLLKDMSAALSTAVAFMERAQGAEKFPKGNISRGINFYDEVSQFETELIRRALQHTGGSQRHAARLLGIKETTLRAMTRRYNIDPHDLRRVSASSDLTEEP